MKKKHIKKVKIPLTPITNTYVEVTEGTPEIYKITLTYADGYKESYYRSFYDEDDCERYCHRIFSDTNDCLDCRYEFRDKITFDDFEQTDNKFYTIWSML